MSAPSERVFVFVFNSLFKSGLGTKRSVIIWRVMFAWIESLVDWFYDDSSLFVTDDNNPVLKMYTYL